MKSVSLPGWHYASRWPNDSAEAIRPLEEVTELGRRYAETKDSSILLELCQCFHPYLMKYLIMICRGHVPVIGVGWGASRINKDVEPFIKSFLPKGQEVTRHNLASVVRQFHLAFKGMEPEEIYDVLMAQLVSAVNGYDPCYKDKLRKVVEVIQHELPKQKQFSSTLVRRHLEFDGTRHLRLLVRAGFLRTAPGRGKQFREGCQAYSAPGR